MVWVHWVVYNLPPGTKSLPENAGKAGLLAAAVRASAFAATAMPSSDRRFTGDWAKENDRRAAGQQAERQRMADYYARLTREQDERENKEARERFAENQRKRWGGSKTD